MSGTMLLICSIVMFGLAERIKGESCPPKYLRFSQKHSYCLSPNPNCNILARGLLNGQKDIDIILKTHNKLRNKVATGKETQAGGLPTASNMMQMVWDEELAAVAQKWVEHCQWPHDCNECRSVEDYPVGQNAFKSGCPSSPCNTTPHWESTVGAWYDEVTIFDKDTIKKMGHQTEDKMIGHLTQVIWADSWRVGCGFAAFPIGQNITLFSICNYGPVGNYPSEPIYIEGPPCSNCPINTCCGSTCSEKPEFEGLCIMNNEDGAPKYPVSTEGLLFNCDFEVSNEDCKYTIEGAGAEIKKTHMGNILAIQLNGGEETEVFFTKTFHPHSDFCLRVHYRQGPAIAGEENLSDFEANLVLDWWSTNMNLTYNTKGYYRSYGIDLPKVDEVKLSLNVSLPTGADEHIIDISKILAFDGDCSSRDSND